MAITDIKKLSPLRDGSWKIYDEYILWVTRDNSLPVAKVEAVCKTEAEQAMMMRLIAEAPRLLEILEKEVGLRNQEECIRLANNADVREVFYKIMGNELLNDKLLVPRINETCVGQG